MSCQKLKSLPVEIKADYMNDYAAGWNDCLAAVREVLSRCQTMKENERLSSRVNRLESDASWDWENRLMEERMKPHEMGEC